MKVFLLEGDGSLGPSAGRPERWEGSQIAGKYTAYRQVARDLRDEGSESSFFPKPGKWKNRIAT